MNIKDLDPSRYYDGDMREVRDKEKAIYKDVPTWQNGRIQWVLKFVKKE